MPPRYAYWTILAGGLPTAFRAADREDLLPTFQRIREKHPDAEMKWFARGKLWASPEEAQSARGQGAGHGRGQGWARGQARGDKGRPQNRRAGPAAGGPAGGRDGREQRDRDWRPGGEHRDPRQKYKDAKKAKNLDRRNERFARKHGEGDFRRRESSPPPREGWRPKEDWRARPPREKPGSPSRLRDGVAKPHGDKLRPRGFAPRGDRPRFEKPREERPRFEKPREERPRFEKPRGEWRPKEDWRSRPPREKPREERPRFEKPRGEWRPKEDWRSRPPREKAGSPSRLRDGVAKPHGDKLQWKNKPAGGGKRPFERKEFGRGGPRGQGTDEPPQPPRPRGPNREPRPSEEPPPQPPPRPSEPSEPPSSPPERGAWNRKRNRDRGRR